MKQLCVILSQLKTPNPGWRGCMKSLSANIIHIQQAAALFSRSLSPLHWHCWQYTNPDSQYSYLSTAAYNTLELDAESSEGNTHWQLKLSTFQIKSPSIHLMFSFFYLLPSKKIDALPVKGFIFLVCAVRVTNVVHSGHHEK